MVRLGGWGTSIMLTDYFGMTTAFITTIIVVHTRCDKENLFSVA